MFSARRLSVCGAKDDWIFYCVVLLPEELHTCPDSGAAGVLRTSLVLKGFWIYLPMSGMEHEERLLGIRLCVEVL